MENGWQKITHVPPGESFEKYGRAAHHLVLEKDGEKIGSIYYEYFRKPIPFYLVKRIEVLPKYRGQGYASTIRAELDRLLYKNKMPALLENAVENSEMARHLLGPGGWKPIEKKPGWFSKNFPLEKEGALEQAIYAITENYVPPLSKLAS